MYNINIIFKYLLYFCIISLYYQNKVCILYKSKGYNNKHI